MASLMERLEAPVPRLLLWLGAPSLGLFLIVLFVFLRFPYNELTPALSDQIAQFAGRQVQIGSVSPRITIGGPGFAADDIRIVSPDGNRFDLDRLEVRPAWSSLWFTGQPALDIRLKSDLAEAQGMLSLGENSVWNGSIRVSDLAALIAAIPQLKASGLSLTGSMNAEADLVIGPSGAAGPLVVDLRDGSLGHPSMPIAVQFDVATGEVLLGQNPLVEVDVLSLDGPILAASAKGDVLPGQGGGQPTLDISVDIKIKDPAINSMLRGMGVRLNREGRVSLQLSGTIGNPRVM